MQTSWIGRMRTRAVRFAARDLGPLSSRLVRFASEVVESGKNLNYDIRTNGERRLLQSLRRFPVTTVVDAGANRGVWAQEALAAFPSATVHAFEIVPQTFALLQSALGANPRARLVDKGLSDADNTVEVNYAPDNTTISSIIPVAAIHKTEFVRVAAQVTSGDAYCRAEGIDHIDLLKIDVEGAEPMVLRGFSNMLSRKRIDVIQFEYGMANIYARVLLRDLYELLEGHGYAVGKLMPRGVRFKSYHPTDEDFRGPNYVAVSALRQDIGAALQDR